MWAAVKNILYAIPMMVLVFFAEIPNVNAAAAPWSVQSGDSRPAKNIQEGKKRGGIVGDPSRHRGVLLGNDAGAKAAKGDWAQGAKPAPTSHPEYLAPEKLYRYEYGSRTMFLSGFRAGFLSAYRANFLKSANLQSSENTPQGVVPAVAVEGERTRTYFGSDAL